MSEEEFPDFEGDFVPIIICLLETIIEDSNDDKEKKITKYVQKDLAYNWKEYDANLFYFLGKNKNLGVWLLRRQEQLRPGSRYSMANYPDLINCKEIMDLVDKYPNYYRTIDDFEIDDLEEIIKTEI